MKKLILPLCLILLYACGNNSGSDEKASVPYMVENGVVVVPDNSPILSSIKIETIGVTDYNAVFSASGTVQPVSSKYVEIATPFTGRITKSFVRPGQKVLPGSPIFEISSPDFSEVEKSYFQAKQEMGLALKSLERERDLFSNSVGVAKDLEEAETNYELCKKEYENALAAIEVYQIDAEKMVLGQPLTVKSPIAGSVVKSNIVVGQYIKEDAEPLVIVADLSNVWVVAHVKEKDIPMLRNIANVEISLSAVPNTLIKGTIYYIGELLDEATRSVEVIIECDNPEHIMKPLMYGSVRFFSATTKAIMVPNSAVLQDENSSYVLVSEGKNRFHRANVNIASGDNGRTVILSGLSVNDSIITEGAFYFIEAR